MYYRENVGICGAFTEDACCMGSFNVRTWGPLGMEMHWMSGGFCGSMGADAEATGASADSAVLYGAKTC